MEAGKLEVLHSLAIEGGEHQQESENPEVGSDQNVWNSRLRPRNAPCFKHGTGLRGSASGSKAGPNVASAVDHKKLSFSLKASLSKKEITQDFLLMTGKKPSLKPKKRTKAEKNRIPGLEMGSTLTDVCPDKYEIHME